MAENFFDDSFSQKSGPSTKSKSRKEIKEKEEAASDKKKIKILKAALVDERQNKEDMMAELQALKQRNKELELECHETSNKYLRLYDENDKLQEYV